MTINVQKRCFNIRPITQDDLDAVLKVYQQCEDFLALGPVPAASLQMVLQDVAYSRRERGMFCGVYTSGEEMVGVVDYIPRDFEGNPHVAYFSLIMIAGPFRDQGIGTAVIEAVENEIRSDAQITAISTGVQVNNVRAVQFWQKRGYRIVSGPVLQEDHTTVLGLRKDLADALGGMCPLI